MGAKVAQVKSEAKTYRVENDNAPFYDNKLGGSTLPEDLNNKEYKAFETFFLKIFPKPILLHLNLVLLVILLIKQVKFPIINYQFSINFQFYNFLKKHLKLKQ